MLKQMIINERIQSENVDLSKMSIIQLESTSKTKIWNTYPLSIPAI